MKVIAQGDPIEYEVSDPADACRLYRQDMTAALIGVVTSATDYERAKRLAESVRLFNEERKRLQQELDQAKAREAGLNLAATQYSESRDHWMREAKRLRAVLEERNKQIAERFNLG